ncbi:MAG: radical SAM protein [Candidatus Omnitrophica bacterium]|nr:radical SAM protein [Candidatus Omnitrophota bacterium]
MISLIVLYSDITCYGPRLISSYLKANGIKTQMLFFFAVPGARIPMLSKEKFNEVVSFCQSSELIGLSVMSPYLSYAQALTTRFKEMLDVPVVWGGAHPTFEPESCLKYADIVCVGEGENAMLELVVSMAKYGTVDHTIKNLWFKTADGIVKNDIRPLEQNIDKFPAPDYDLKSQYICRAKKKYGSRHVLQMTRQLLLENSRGLRGDRKWYATTTSRGCPQNCSFCANSASKILYRGKGKFNRKRSVASVLDEIEDMTKTFAFQAVCLSDENLFIRNNEEIDLFATGYKKRIGLPFYIEFSPQLFDPQKANKLIDAGCEVFQIGVQTACDKTNNELYLRKQTREQFDPILSFLKNQKAEFRTYFDFILMNPWEEPASLLDSIKFILSLDDNISIVMYPLTFFPGTQLYDRAMQEGLVGDSKQSATGWGPLRYIQAKDIETILFLIVYVLRKVMGARFSRWFIAPALRPRLLSFLRWKPNRVALGFFLLFFLYPFFRVIKRYCLKSGF